MRPRFRGRARRRIAKGKKDWVVGIWGEDVDQPVGLNSTQYYTLITEDVLEDKDDKLTVLRIVGDFWTLPIDGPSGIAVGSIKYWHGIKVFEVDETGALLPQSPNDVDNADGSWMYLRVGYKNHAVLRAGDGVTNYSQETMRSRHLYQNSGWGEDHIDVQVKRRLTGREVLIFAAGCQGVTWGQVGSVSSCTHAGFLRILVGNL